ncbi:MAG: hypothetical protein JNL57_13890 [Bacteroidetes bacterium]|nr:hypothetical protein [Bacteroidota bacterium]
MQTVTVLPEVLVEAASGHVASTELAAFSDTVFVKNSNDTNMTNERFLIDDKAVRITFPRRNFEFCKNNWRGSGGEGGKKFSILLNTKNVNLLHVVFTKITTILSYSKPSSKYIV